MQLSTSCVGESVYRKVEDEMPTYSDEDPCMERSSVQITNDVEYVATSISDGTLTSSSVSIQIENKSVDKFVYYNPVGYYVEQIVDGIWFRLPLLTGTRGSSATEQVVRPTQTGFWRVDWSNFYGELTSGEYRIVWSARILGIELNKAGEIDNKMIAVGENYLSVEFWI